MSDTDTSTETEDTSSADDVTAVDDSDDGEFDRKQAMDKIHKSNREAQSLRKQLREAQEKAAKYDEYESSQKTELQRAIERAEAAEKSATEFKQSKLRMDVALAKGLDAAQAKRLVGETQEDLEADADELLTAFGKSDSSDDGARRRRPASELRGGSDPTSGSGANLTPDQLAKMIHGG